MSVDACIFCEIAAGTAPAHVVWEVTTPWCFSSGIR
jgi:hypothetical protein